MNEETIEQKIRETGIVDDKSGKCYVVIINDSPLGSGVQLGGKCDFDYRDSSGGNGSGASDTHPVTTGPGEAFLCVFNQEVCVHRIHHWLQKKTGEGPVTSIPHDYWDPPVAGTCVHVHVYVWQA